VGQIAQLDGFRADQPLANTADWRWVQHMPATHDELFKALLEELMTGRLRVPVAEEV